MKTYLFYLKALIYITLVLTQDSELQIISLILITSTLSKESIPSSLLILPIALIAPSPYKYLIPLITILYISLNKYTKSNRLYSLILFLTIIISVNITIFLTSTYHLKTLITSLISLLFYTLIELICKYTQNKYVVINQDLMHLYILLFLTTINLTYTRNTLALYITFTSLFLTESKALTLLFTLATITIALPLNQPLIPIITASSLSFIPPLLLFLITYKPQSIYIITLLILICLKAIIKPKASYTPPNEYKETYDKFLEIFISDYSRLKAIKSYKHTRLHEIISTYCKECQNPRCQSPYLHIPFLSNAIVYNDSNTINCPHYDKFLSNTNIEYKIEDLTITSLHAITKEIDDNYSQISLRNKEFSHLKSILKLNSINLLNVTINKTINQYYTLTLTKSPQITPKLLPIIKTVLHEDLDIKIIDENPTKIHLYTPPKCHIQISHEILAKEGNLVSGDNYLIKKFIDETYLIALSDGMGAGHKAYMESSSTLQTLSKLLTLNLSIPTIIKSLLELQTLRCDFDSYATLDILIVNTAQMKIHLYKFGSASTYIIHNNEITEFENHALPFDTSLSNSYYELDIYYNDVILLLSDGIVDYIDITDLKKINYALAIEQITSNITSALKKKSVTYKDDASVVAIKITP